MILVYSEIVFDVNDNVGKLIVYHDNDTILKNLFILAVLLLLKLLDNQLYFFFKSATTTVVAV